MKICRQDVQQRTLPCVARLVAVVCMLCGSVLAQEVDSADTRQAVGNDDVGASNDREQWSRRFKNGDLIELIGIGEFPSQQTKNWWKPSGGVLAKAPYEFIRASFITRREALVRREFAFRVKGELTGTIDMTVKDSVSRGGFWSPELNAVQASNVRAVAAFFPADVVQTKLVIGRGKGEQREEVTFAKVPLFADAESRAAAAAAKRSLQKRSVQRQKADPPQYYVQTIHENMRDSEIWLDLKRRLEASGMKYRSVSVDENGECGLCVRFGTPDLSHLRGAKLTSLMLDHTGQVDLESLRGMPLKRLSLQFSQISDLSPLKGMLLESLSISGTAVSDLSPLSEARLKTLLASRETSDLSPLAGQPLDYLDLRGSKVTDLTPLRSMQLSSLQLEKTRVADLSPLKGLSVETLTLSWRDGMDLRELQGLPITWLKLEGTGFDDVSALAGLKLERLYLNETAVHDLSPLKDLPLWELSLRRTPVVDLSPLQELKLTQLYVSEPGIDLAPVSNMPLEHIGIPNPKTVKNLDVLRSMKTLKSIRPPLNKPIPVDEFWQRQDQTAQAPERSGGNS